MDGTQARLTASLQRRLSIRLSLAILGIALIAGAFCFASAFHEAYEFQDEVLRQVASLIGPQGSGTIPVPGNTPDSDHDKEARVFVQRLGPLMPGSAAVSAQPAFSSLLHDGLQTVDVAQGSFRVYVRTLPSGERLAISQRTEARDEIARHSSVATLMPFLLLVPLLLLMVTNSIRKMLQPIAALSAEVDRRSDRELHPIDTQTIPSEIRPLIVAINRLLARVSRAMQEQHRFIADAAHELRSPMTALSLQAERLAHMDMSQEGRERLTALRRGIDRGRALLEQLLTLARAQSGKSGAQGFVSVHRVFRRVLEDLMPQAESRDINIGVTSEIDVPVCANEADLVALLRNLVDNAIRYTPAHGRVDLAVHAETDSVVIDIADTGPGIAPSERARVFDPFYRVAGSPGIGSGLGLSIVDSMATRAGAVVTLAYADERAQTGLRVIVRFPSDATNQIAARW
jgi:two-component system OmpR family sensor kinase